MTGDWRVAIITSTYPLQVQMSGEAVALNEPPICLIDDPHVGDYVFCEYFGQLLVIMGRVADGSTALPQLGNTEDLNNFLYTGAWGQTLNANTDTARNYPVERAGLFEVFRVAEDGHMVHQRYSTYDNKAIFWRSYYNSTGWASWMLIAGDTGWSTVALQDTTDFSLYSGYGNIQVRRTAMTCYLRGALKNTTAGTPPTGTTSTSFATLPSWAPPPQNYPLNFICQCSGATHFCLRINQDGTMYAERVGPTAAGAGAWFPFNVQWTTDDMTFTGWM